ncbi:hypothetical protein [Kitasatospora aureofaciens]|uniref:hypothetical protein n=1 Tax=Kitasatospora aureofaciens TaxID=1894 RepID=UPI0037C7C0D2
MPYDEEPSFRELALGALADHGEEQRQEAKARVADAARTAATAAENTFGAVAAGHLLWTGAEPTSDTRLVATAPIPDTPGWRLRWTGSSDRDGDFVLVRPCPEGGHCDPVYAMSDIGAHLERLNRR